MKKKLLAALLAVAMLMGLASATFAANEAWDSTKLPTSIFSYGIKPPGRENQDPDANKLRPGSSLQMEHLIIIKDGTKFVDYEGPVTCEWSVFAFREDDTTATAESEGIAIDAKGLLTVGPNATPGLTIYVYLNVKVDGTKFEANNLMTPLTVIAGSSSSADDSSSSGGDTPPGGTSAPGSSSSSSTSGSSSGGSSSGASAASAAAEETMSTTEAAQKTEQAVAAALKADPDAAVAVVKVRNAESITAAALRAVVKAAVRASEDIAPIIHADVVKDGKVESRLYIDPSKATLTSDIKLGVTLGDEKVSAKFDKYFTNSIAVVKFDQVGSFGMSIKAAVKLDLSELDTDTLVFYSYNPKTNTYVKIAAPGYTIDRNGYLHFTTSVGNCIIVTDEPLTRK